MARPTKKSAAGLRAKLKAAAKKRGHRQDMSKLNRHPAKVPDKTRFTHEITKDRIRLGLLLGRIEQHGLGELKKMPPTQLAAAQYLVDKIIPKAVAPQQLQVSGNITVIRRDPTARPEGYQRKGRASV
jgi:hypothetical protein